MEGVELSPTDIPGEFQFTMPAPEGSRFTKDALDGNVGKTTPIPGHGRGTITAVEVIDDGEFALITVRMGSDNGDN